MHPDVFDKIVKSPQFKRTLGVLGVLAVLLFVFQAGLHVGYRKAAFSYQLGNNYYRAFDGTRGMPFPGQPFEVRAPFPGAHGATGRIVSVTLPTFVIENSDQVEKVIRIDEGTEIRRFRESVEPSEIMANDFAIVIGDPTDDALIQAKFIRLLPPPDSNN